MRPNMEGEVYGNGGQIESVAPGDWVMVAVATRMGEDGHCVVLFLVGEGGGWWEFGAQLW